jgi:large subunit ribosomal protein L24
MSKDKTSAARVRLKRDDSVRVIAGKEKGKTGRILRIDRERGRVFIHGLNMVKKAVKKRKQTDRGGIIDIEGSVAISNVMIVCPKCGPTRISYKIEGEVKHRVCRKCGEPL